MTSPTPTPVHIHSGMRCPVTSERYGYCPQQEGDSRSPCPALNTMANHGYIARDGKNIGVVDLVRGLRACYGLSRALAFFLAVGGFFLLRRTSPVSLLHIGKHEAIEHNASLVHDDCPTGEEYAPITPQAHLVDHLLNDSTEKDNGSETGGEEALLSVQELAKYRMWRQRQCGPLDSVHAEIARGEMAIIFGVWNSKVGSKIGVPKLWLREWFLEGRLPRDWKPTHRQRLLDTMRRSKEIRDEMDKLKRGSTSTLQSEKSKKA